MPEQAQDKAFGGENDRRRNPRFQCGGRAKIIYLPSDGILVAGKVRDLSLGGCCVETNFPMETGAKAELILNVNAATFRALGEVRATRGQSGVCMRFLQLSSGGQALLAELLTQLARLKALTKSLQATRGENREEILQVRSPFTGSRAWLAKEHFPMTPKVIVPENPKTDLLITNSDAPTVDAEITTDPIDLFI